MITVYNKHKAIRTPPINLKKEDIKLFAHEFTKEVQSTNVNFLTHSYILRDTIFYPRLYRFYLSFTHMDPVTTKSICRRLILLLKPGDHIKKGLWIIDNWSSGYFHWLTDALPRLIAAENYLDHHFIILPSFYANVPYIKDSLSFFNYPIFYYDTRKKLKVDDLILPSHTAFTGNYNKVLINKLRDKFIGTFNVVPNRKIYISRLKAPKRKIVNEAEVVNVLKKYDYEIHYFEEYDFKTQIKIMSEAISLIGLHGAGLTNMLFMKEKGQVLELRNEGDNHNNCYFSLASDLNIAYYYQQNKGNKPETNTVDIIVDLKEFEKNIELMQVKLQDL